MRQQQLVLGLVAGLAGCAAFAQDRYDGFLCCNMRSDGKWISDANYADAGTRVIPAGTPVTVDNVGRKKIGVRINGDRQTIGNDYSRDLSPEVFAARYVPREDPRPKIATWPAKVRDAVSQSRITAGMTREQVLASIGYPITSENPSLDANLWRYWLDSFTEFQVEFDGQGQVTRVVAEAPAHNRVWLP